MTTLKAIAVLALTLFFMPLHSQTQTKEKELSNAEQFSAKAGTLLQKEFIDVGAIKGAKIQVMLLKDLMTTSKTSGVRFEMESAARYGGTKVAVLDADEVDALLKSIKILQSTIFNSTAPNYTEVIYKSRGGFEAGCYFSEGKWETYLKLEKYDKDSYVFLSAADFDELTRLLTSAKAKL